MKKYRVIEFTLPEEHRELFVAAAGRVEVAGILEEEDVVSLYFEDRVDLEQDVREILSWLPPDVNVERRDSEVAEQNWNAEFEASLSPVEIDERLIITQSWNPVEPKEGQLVAVIDPKMSFGTGHHETTRLVSSLMLSIDVAGKRVLDVGTGTGLLAVLAALMDAEAVDAFDNNEWAVENARENLMANGVSDSVMLFQGELSDLAGGTYDVIVANLHLNLILSLLPELIDRLSSSQARLVLSGILLDDREYLMEQTDRNGLELVDERRENEWFAASFRSAASNS